jgi:hypothetical protein
MRYVDYATGGAQFRNNAVDLDNIPKSILPDSYMTYFWYGDDFKDYVEKNKSVKGFKGLLNADYLPFDIDNEDLEKARLNAINITRCLQMRYGLYNADMDIYFTGAKGFHIQIPAAVFGGFDPSFDLAEIFKLLAFEISAGYDIDGVIYEPMRLWRIPNTINSKTGLYKIGITLQELNSLTIDKIKELAHLPREPIMLDANPNDMLIDLYKKVKESLLEKKEKPKIKSVAVNMGCPVGEKFCIYSMLNNGVVPGERNNAVLRLAVYFNSKFPPNTVYDIIKNWNEEKGVGLDEREIKTTVDSSLTGYDFGCEDGLLKKNCSPQCQFIFRKKKGDVVIKTIVDLEKEYCDYIKEIDKIKINLADWLPKFSKVSRGLTPGEVVVTIAGSGVGKSALLQNLIWNIKSPSVFFSYEMPEVLTYERFYQIANECSGEDVEIRYKTGGQDSIKLKSGLRGMYSIFNPDITVDEIPGIVQRLELERGEKMHIVAIDYLGLVKGGVGSRYERVSYIAEKLKDIAKKTNSVVFCLAQVSRQEGAKGDEVLSITSAKDSGSIENTGDLVLGLYRPDKNAKEEDYKNTTLLKIKILKNRKGVDGVVINCDFDKTTLCIREKVYVPEDENNVNNIKRIFSGREI